MEVRKVISKKFSGHIPRKILFTDTYIKVVVVKKLVVGSQSACGGPLLVATVTLDTIPDCPWCS